MEGAAGWCMGPLPALCEVLPTPPSNRLAPSGPSHEPLAAGICSRFGARGTGTGDDGGMVCCETPGWLLLSARGETGAACAKCPSTASAGPPADTPTPLPLLLLLSSSSEFSSGSVTR